MSSPITKETVVESLHACISISTNGVITQFAKLIRKPLITVYGWYQGTVKIPFCDLVRICYCLNLSILDFLSGAEAIRNNQRNIRELPDATHVIGKPRTPKPFNYRKVKAQLMSCLDVVPPISMAEAARRMNANHRDIYQKFPELSRKISSRYRAYHQDFYRAKRIKLEEEVRQAVIHLYAQGIYPSPRPVTEYLNKPTYFGRRDVAAIIRETRELLDAEKNTG
jgi:hypothetical protein